MNLAELARIALFLIVPFLFAWWASRLLRAPQLLRRIAIVAYATALCVAGLFPLSQAVHLGIDLSGGTILVYQVEQPPPGFQIDKMVAAINQRLNPAGVTDVTIRAVGTNRVEITIPHASAEDVERYKRLLTSVGSLEFRILANRHDNTTLIGQAEQTFPNPVLNHDKVVARWVPVAPSTRGEFSSGGDIALRTNPQGQAFVLLIHDPYNVTGEFLERAQSSVDETGRPAVSFQFNTEGARRFAQLTGQNLPDTDGFERRLAIVLNGEVYSAPSIRSQISDRGIITGHFTQREVSDLVTVLNAGSLPATLTKAPVSETTAGPTLGQDTIRSGLLAIAISTAAVLIFMAVYYRIAGLIADIAVVLNVLIVVGTMAWLHGTWTLAGLAGLALTVGMAVDTNVLIYERLREEQDRSPRLIQAIDNGFRHAFRTIFDAHVTILLAGAVLYFIGSEQVKGFALTLMLGLAANLFTAVFVCRLIFDIFQYKHWVERFGMFTLLSRPNYDFVGKRVIAAVGSSLLILVGLAAAWGLGSNLLDIDFTGGTLAAVRMEQPTSIATVRRLADQTLPNATVEELQIYGEPAGHRFLLRTTLQNPDEVKSRIVQKFGNLLAHVQTQIGPIQPVPSTSAPSMKNRVELSFNQPVAIAAVRSELDHYLAEHGFQDPQQRYTISAPGTGGGEQEYRQLQVESNLDQPVLQQSLAGVQAKLATTTTFDRLDNFGGEIIGSTQQAALIAILVSIAVIAGYLWIRFQNVLFGVATVIALVHDVLVVLGLLAISHWLTGWAFGRALGIEPFKINLAVIAAFLTLVGYSVNDTIVVFDRIREVRGRSQSITWELINNAVNQTLSRTILTSFTTWLVSLILYIVGGAAIHDMAFCLVTGVVVGTYSSIYIASPVLIWFGRQQTPQQSPAPANAKSQGRRVQNGQGKLRSAG